LRPSRKPPILVAIVNVIATCKLNTTADLKRLGTARSFVYDVHKYQGKVAYFKDKSTKGKVSIFKSGKLISVGTKNESDAFNDLRYASLKMKGLHMSDGRIYDFKIRNVVATVDLGIPIDVEKVSGKVSGIVYEPDQFPGAMFYLVPHPDVSVLLFATGKAVLAGLKSELEVPTAAEDLADFLSSL
jgi:transcription initiation factor TFIID TATA-box-binding protein